MPEVIGMLHAALLVSDLARARGFYEDVLGLSARPDRPDLGFDGVWYDVGGGAQIHLLRLDNPDPVTGRPEHGGRDRHVALAVAGWTREQDAPATAPAASEYFTCVDGQ